MSLHWHPLVLANGDLNGAVKRATEHASGVYAVREAATHTVVYVGESSRGVMWKTMLRHFQAPESFRKVRETGVFARSPRGYEVAYRVTSKGKRARASGKAADQEATRLQAEWIARMHPTRNRDDGKADDFVLEQQEEEGIADLLNPAGAWIELGRLTRLTYEDASGRERVLRWGLRKAPILAYNDQGRMIIVYASRVVGEASDALRKEYDRTHWGHAGRGDDMIGDVALPPFKRLGKALVITYTTIKGPRGEPTDYVHPFGEGTRKKWIAPSVEEHVCQGPKCADRGRVTLRGGTYRVTDRGIVG